MDLQPNQLHRDPAAFGKTIHTRRRRQILFSFILFCVAVQIGFESRKSNVWVDRTLGSLFTEDKKTNHSASMDAGTKKGLQQLTGFINTTDDFNQTHFHHNYVNLSLWSLSSQPLQIRSNDNNESYINNHIHNSTSDSGLPEVTDEEVPTGQNLHSKANGNELVSIQEHPPIITSSTASAGDEKTKNKTHLQPTTAVAQTSDQNEAALAGATSLSEKVEPSLLKSSKWLLTNQSTPDNTSTRHVYTKGVLDLLPWEMRSIREYQNMTDSEGIKLLGTCQTPHETIPNTCCFGSFSGGGSVTRNWAHQCFKDQGTYDRVATIVLRDLQRTDHLVNEDCDICRVVELINKFDLKFAISGDSMMSQNVDGFFCELHRRGYRVTKVNTTLVDPFTMVGLKEIQTHEISGPTHWKRPARVTFLFQYRPIVAQMEQIVPSYDVLIMNFGLHWRYEKNGHDTDKEGYEDTISKLLNVTLHHGNVTLLAHRETSAQHHNYTGGEWASERTACVPLNFQNHSDVVGWRERVVQTKAKELGYEVVTADETVLSAGKPLSSRRELVILPFFNLTASLFDLHPDECTHYCSTPFLWMPIWRGLRLAMDRQWNENIV